MPACKHRTIMKGMCCDCGLILSSHQLSELTRDVVSMVHSIPDLLVNIEEAKEIGSRDITRLLNQQKLILIVDLDHTLVHACPVINQSTPTPISDQADIYRLKANSTFLDVAIRPHSVNFLDKLSQFFELHVFTLGTRDYAHQVVRMLDPENKLINDRIRSRCDSTSSISKEQEIARIFPTGEHMVIVLDDRRDVWGGVDNIIQVVPFFFFDENETNRATPVFTRNFTKDTINNIYEYCGQSSYIDHLLDILLKFHKIFFKCYEAIQNKLDVDSLGLEQYFDDTGAPNLKNIISYERSKTLCDCKIIFSGIIPIKGDFTDNIEYLLATFLGAQVVDRASSPDITHLITNGTITEKAKRIINSGLSISIVFVDWLYCCYYLGERADESFFKFSIEASNFDEDTSELESQPDHKRKSIEGSEENNPQKIIPVTLEDFLDDETLKDFLQNLENDLDGSADQTQSEATSDKDYIYINTATTGIYGIYI
ncbi:hypothetical protein HZS_1500 [Henneguya salminicola]|nr:hypothetical protein HZS_1500 [Henneguya salminicola]